MRQGVTTNLRINTGANMTAYSDHQICIQDASGKQIIIGTDRITPDATGVGFAVSESETLSLCPPVVYIQLRCRKSTGQTAATEILETGLEPALCKQEVAHDSDD